MSHIFASFGRRSMLILFVVGRGCGGLAPTVFSRIIICSMCVGMLECVCVCVLAIYGLQLFACCAGIALSLATLASFMSWLVLLFNWQVLCALKNCLTCRARQWLMTMREGGGRCVWGRATLPWRAYYTKVCQCITCCFYGIRHTHTQRFRHTYTFLTQASTRLKC